MPRERVTETPLEVMYSQVFGLDLTEEQILEAGRRPKPKQADVFFGPIARKWHKEHPLKPVTDDDSHLLGC
jgi:hypothetical protein